MIGRETIDRIRARTDLVALIGESVKLQRRGRSHTGLCPFHQEKSPSFSVSEEKGLFYCFGCKASGDCFKFLELHEGLSFIEATKKLAERAGIELVDERSDYDRQAESRARKAKEDLYGINAMAAGYFARMLREHPHASFARDELARRGLGLDGEAAPALERFKIGYAPSGWDGLSGFLRAQGVSPAQAAEVGLLAARSSGSGHYDLFRHRLMVGIIDVQGRVVAFSWRTLPEPPGTPAPAPDQKPPKYVNSKESAIYQKGQNLFGLFQARNAIRSTSEAVIVEGNFDLVAMHARGIENVVAPLGTAFTPEQAKLLRRFCNAVTLMFDADAAGKKATWAARQVCLEAGLEARAARVPSGKDPDEFLQSKGAAAMRDVLSAARSVDELLIDDLTEPVGPGANLAQKRAVLERVRPLLEAQELAFREQLAKRVAVRMGLEVPTLWAMVRGESVAASRMERAAEPARPVTDEERLSRKIVEILLSVPELVDDPELEDALAWISGDWALALVALRESMRKARLVSPENPTLDAADLLARIPSSIQEMAAARLCAPTLDSWASGDASLSKAAARDERTLAAEGSTDPVIARRVVRENALKLENAVTRARLDEIAKEIEIAERSGDFGRAIALGKEKQERVVAHRAAQARLRAAPRP
jgi:DNA primase